MGQQTKIQWADHTFNPWIGCTKVSDGCRNCYAEAQDRRWGHESWGPGALRRVTSAANWRTPLRWAKAAELAGERRRVFCASLADVFDAEAPEGALDALWRLIRETPALDWLLVTKRPERIATSLPVGWGEGWPNVWLGTSVENQAAAEARLPHLLSVPAVVHFASVEPLLGPVDLFPWMLPGWKANSSLDWAIVGGESGGVLARYCELSWVRRVVRDAKMAGVAVFVKQLGARAVVAPGTLLELRDSKGGDLTEWPADLQVRELPRRRAA